MTLTLIRIRHCKSDWDAGIASDHARPLNPRGRRAAPRIGAWLAATALIPDQTLCSDATRTRETWAGIADQLPQKPTLTLSHTLYHAEPATILTQIQSASARTLAVIGHNPGIGMLAHHLADTRPDHPRFDDYPTGATTVLTFDVPNWTTLPQGHLTQFTTPRDLPDPA